MGNEIIFFIFFSCHHKIVKSFLSKVNKISECERNLFAFEVPKK